MELRHLRAFVAVVEAESFRRAAARLRVAQPPLTRQIQALEAELGVRVLDRGPRRVVPTAAGALLLARARRVLAEVDAATREASRAARGEVGQLVVGYPSSLAYSGLVDVLRAFRARAPEVDVVLREMTPQQQVDALRVGALDVGFVRGPLVAPDLASEVVLREALVAALPADHRLAGRARVAVGQLADDPFVFFARPRAPEFFDHVMRLCHEAGFSPRLAQEAPFGELVSLVAAGFGVSLLPASTRHLRRDGLALRPLVGSPRTEMLVAWPKQAPSPVRDAFLDVVRATGVRRARRRARASAGGEA